ncbi:MAG: 2'-5' RNA ligase family protein [Candidatus Zixiibacteriota bacterium]|nr:MAG: 2'-5' RNA ligase family protein [candidate division Zixibacteria bacterium]
MFYCLSFYPQLSPELAESIDAIRRVYDPTFRFKPHITVIFPVHDSVGEQSLTSHIERVLSDWNPFEIRLGGFYKSRDHWLFLTLREGEGEMKRLYKSLYTGILEEYGREYIPHLGLGLFLKEGCIYDWSNPREEDFDLARYEVALRQAKELPLSETFVMETLQLTMISDQWIEWVTGRRATVPDEGERKVVQEFRLGSQNAKNSNLLLKD